MNQIRIGEFLKELRKEKGITQEQLAEQFNISRRSVSRWETGSNMPDITLLVELAEFYDVSISEIIDGERKSEKMNEEVKETALKVSDYAETINQTNSIYKRIASVGLGLDLGMLTVIAMYLSGVLGKIKAKE
ncbi:MAG: helix-turn-helix transcriptional regulator [Lachnospiraceae bacterium]|nr:helix-turn-helix transcriptional regulator [Lachnospiraceae bacterium]